MAVLQKREAEIPLNGGMDTKQGAELQSMSTLRLVEDLRWNAAGELEKRPATASDAPLTSPSDSAYVSTALSGIYTRGDELFALTKNHGLVSMSPDGDELAFMRRVVDEGSNVDGVLKYAPICANVSRRFVARANGKSEILIDAVASAVYGNNQLIAWTTRDAAFATIMHVKVIDLTTGVTVMPEKTTILGANFEIGLSAISINEVGYEGVFLSVSIVGSGAPYDIYGYRWDSATNDFGYWGLLTTNAKSFKHTLAPARDGLSFYFGYTDNISGFLEVYNVTIAGGLGASHVANHGALSGVAIVPGTTRVLIVSVAHAGAAYASKLYAEVFGTPGSVLTLRTINGAAAVDRFTSVHVTTESRAGVTNAAVVWATGVDQQAASGVSGNPGNRFVSAHVVNFTNTAPTEFCETYIPNVACVGAGTVDGRAYGVFALNPQPGVIAPGITSLIVARATYHLSGASDPFRHDPVARVCHERFAVWNYDYGDNDAVSVSGTTLCFAMQADPAEGQPQTLFAAQVDFDARPMARVDMNDGTALFGNGMLHSYDGDMPSEAQPIARPVVGMDAPGAGALTGTVSAIAVLSWVDASGNIHRSEPSEAFTAVLAAQSLDVYVTCPPFTAYDGPILTGYTLPSNEITCELYLTEVNGSLYYRANNSTAYRTYTSKTFKGLWFKFTNVTAGDPSFPPLYTTGAAGLERASKAPPAFRAIARVGDLLWAIDAEDPSRIWHTKPLVAGYAPEWNTLNTLTIGDAGVGISDVNGVPTIFAERGIWQVYGEGPNALGVGSFAPARRLPHEVECLDGLSVCKTGSGVFFRGRRGVYLLDTGLALQPVGLSIDPNLTVSGVPSGYCRIVYDELSNEVHVLDFDGSHYVFNLLESKWCEWSQTKPFQQWQDAATVRGRMYFTHTGSTYDSIRRVRALDESSHNAHTKGWTIETPWLRFDGATGEMRIWECIEQIRVSEEVSGAKRGGGLTVLYETRDGVSESHSWTSEEIAVMAAAFPYASTINLLARITQQRARQFRLTITESDATYAYSGHVPIAVRVLYGITPRGGRQTSTGQSKGKTVES